MEFTNFMQEFTKHFEEMINNADYLFEVEVDKDELWNLYLDSFPEGTNKIYRKRREFDCSCCRHFMKSFGNVVVIKDNKIHTLWDFNTDERTFQPVINALHSYISTHVVTNLYVSKFNLIGTRSNNEYDENSKRVITWNHFYVNLPDRLVNHSSSSIGEIQGQFRDTRNVFKRSLDEITEDAVLTVLELISSNTLYKGAEWKNALDQFLVHKRQYSNLSEADKEIYAWEQAGKVGTVIGRIRNHSVGTLLVNIGEGMDLDEAVRKYEMIVAPTNYKRPKAIFTQKMLEDAKKTITEMGYMDSLARRFATLDDISVNNILFSNKDAAKRINSNVGVFDAMMSEVAVSPKKFSRVEEIPIDKFISDVVPTARSIEAYVENRHASNMVSLIAPQKSDAQTMFKWNNGFSWAYSGNITDSDVKQNVKNAGGKVDGVLRFSIQWNDEDYNPNDFDAHCVEPTGNRIYYGNEISHNTLGNLDVDIRWPRIGKPAVENITWPSLEKMRDGKYQFSVHNYAHRGGRSGFKAEIEFNGEIYSFVYNKELRHGETIDVAEVTLQNKTFSIKELLPANMSVTSKEVWGINTNQFIPVTVLMYSPNYWDEQQGIGHKHYMFMLNGCVNPEQPNGFYNEFLKQELVQHKRVFEALGGKMAVESVEDQLSGLGFSSTKRNDLVVKVKGQTERIMRIKF